VAVIPPGGAPAGATVDLLLLPHPSPSLGTM